MTRVAARLLTLAAVATTLAGCGHTTVIQLPTKAAAVKKAAPTAEAKAPAVHVITGQAYATASADAATVNVELSFEADGSVRQLQAVNDIEVAAAPAPAATTSALFAQLDRVEFVVTYDGGKTLTYTVKKADFLDGKAVVQFNNLPAGHLTVTATAKDAAGKQLITANGEGDIKIGELTLVKLKCVAPAAPGVGHVRLEMDCWSDGSCDPVPTPAPSGFVPFPIEDVSFSSLGDPHEDGANGLKYANQQHGTFLSLRTLTNDFALVKHQDADRSGKWPGATVNDAVGINANGDVFKWLLIGRRVLMNGANVPAYAGMRIKGRNGTLVTFQKFDAALAVADIETTQGDKVRIEDNGVYLNIIGTLGTNRVVHEVRGAFGTFNNGTPNEGMLLRTGAKAASLEAFLNDWHAQPAEDLFADGPAIVPAN